MGDSWGLSSPGQLWDDTQDRSKTRVRAESTGTAGSHEGSSKARAHLRVAMAAARDAPLAFWLGGLLMLVAQLLGSSLRVLPALLDDRSRGLQIGIGASLMLLGFLLRASLRAGYLGLLASRLETGLGGPGMLFERGGYVGRMMAVRLLAGLAFACALVLGALPGITVAAVGAWLEAPWAEKAGLVLGATVGLGAACYAWLSFLLGEWAVALERCRVGAALRRSVRIAAKHRGALFRVWLLSQVLLLFGVLGLALFGVGILLTYPVAIALGDASLTSLYLHAHASGSRTRQPPVRVQV